MWSALRKGCDENVTKCDNPPTERTNPLAADAAWPRMMRTGANLTPSPGNQGSNPMHLRKSLVAAAAIVAAGLMAISGSALAATGSVTGSFVGGSASFAGATYGCTTGAVNGTYNTTAADNLAFTTLSISCSTPVGTATISLNSCTVPVNFTSGQT